MSTAALILEAVATEDGIRVESDFTSTRVKRWATKWGFGCALRVRIEPLDEAKKHHQLKFYFGYLVKPCVEQTGYTVKEMDAIFRALFMPGDVETLSDMSYDQMALYNLAVEEYATRVIGVAIEKPL